ncbi:MAG: flagellar hook capping FlgD N-terminal domain-containing protein [Bryobacteraceae bacterium]
MASSIDAVRAAQGGASATRADQGADKAAAAASDALAQKETFLKLLVAQIRNQNPLQPADAIQFVTQLAQFSELEQLIAIRAELGELRQALAGEATQAGENQPASHTGTNYTRSQ